MTRAGRVVLLLVLAASPLAAQSSQFGVRGLGIPLRPYSVRATGLGGAFALFDFDSAFNPASLGTVGFLSANFQTVQGWRRSESPAGTSNARDNRYPGIFAAGPVAGSTFAVSFSAHGYTDRNFVLASRDTLILRGVPVETFDTLSSQGGLSDLRIGLGWRQSRNVQWGLGLHMITGSNRILSHRTFADTSYGGATEAFTYSYLGVGASAGVVARVARYLTLGGMMRADNRLKVERDSASAGNTRLPLTLSGGARLQVGERMLVAGSVLFRNWSVSSKDIIAQGGVGSVNTTEFSGGVEYLTNPKRPYHRPIRLGIRHATLPFPLRAGEQASETAVSAGSSLRFVADRAGLDLALQRVWRKAGPGFTETATLVTIGVTVRP